MAVKSNGLVTPCDAITDEKYETFVYPHRWFCPQPLKWTRYLLRDRPSLKKGYNAVSRMKNALYIAKKASSAVERPERHPAGATGSAAYNGSCRPEAPPSLKKDHVLWTYIELCGGCLKRAGSTRRVQTLGRTAGANTASTTRDPLERGAFVSDCVQQWNYIATLYSGVYSSTTSIASEPHKKSLTTVMERVRAPAPAPPSS